MQLAIRKVLSSLFSALFTPQILLLTLLWLIGLITDRNNVYKLLSFMNPALERRGLEPFTIKVEATSDNNTAIFCRDGTETLGFISLHDFRGFGHEFEKAYTTNQVRQWYEQNKTHHSTW